MLHRAGGARGGLPVVEARGPSPGLLPHGVRRSAGPRRRGDGPRARRQDALLPDATAALGRAGCHGRGARRAGTGSDPRAVRDRPVEPDVRGAPARGRRPAPGLRRRPPPPLRLRARTQRRRLLPVLREVRRAGRAARRPGRALGRGDAERRGAAAPPRRRRALLPRVAHRRGPHRLAVGRGADRAGLEAPERVHRHLRPRPEVLGPGAGPVPQVARQGQGPLRHRLPGPASRRGAGPGQGARTGEEAEAWLLRETARKIFKL